MRLIGAQLARGQSLEGKAGLDDVATNVTEGATRAAGDILTAPLRLLRPPEPPPAAARAD